jgi:hypothetical protein
MTTNRGTTQAKCRTYDGKYSCWRENDFIQTSMFLKHRSEIFFRRIKWQVFYQYYMVASFQLLVSFGSIFFQGSNINSRPSQMLLGLRNDMCLTKSDTDSKVIRFPMK